VVSPGPVPVCRWGGGSGSGVKRRGTCPEGRPCRRCAAWAACPRRWARPAEPPRCRASQGRFRRRASAEDPWCRGRGRCRCRGRSRGRIRPERAHCRGRRAAYSCHRSTATHSTHHRSPPGRPSPAPAKRPSSRLPRKRPRHRVPTAYPYPSPPASRTALARPPPKVIRAAWTGAEEWRRGALPCSCTPRFLDPGRPARRRDLSGPFPACVRVTLRVDSVRVGTRPQARGICPERPPTLR
jgi:hypothetical protein